jgi:flagellum-specific peptidoglycan hydrolase FlgJ
LARVITIREPVRKVKEQPPVTSAEENTAPNNPPAFSGNPTEFFDFIGPYAVELWHRHKILPSVTIAQTAIETGYGKSTIGWNFGGVYACCQSDDVLEDTEILYTIDGYTASAYECPQHPGRYKTLLRTKEWDNNGKGTNLVTVQRWFSYYRSMDEFLERRYKLFTSPIYNNILGERDYIKAANCLTYYAKADVYIPAVIAEIENYSLTDWDKIAFDEER